MSQPHRSSLRSWCCRAERTPAPSLQRCGHLSCASRLRCWSRALASHLPTSCPVSSRRRHSERPSSLPRSCRAYTRPAMSAEQVFIVGDADALVVQEASQEAANALLKLLEEPPGGTRFILTSSEPGRLLPTVRSRSVPLHVGRLPGELVRLF